MRFLVALHVGGVFAIVLCLLFLFSDVLALFTKDTSPYILSREELSAEKKAPKDAQIPAIIHQVYLGWDNATMPLEWQNSLQTCKDINKGFEHMLWNNESARNFLEKNYPWFLETYSNYRYPIQQADSIRYFILNHYGGIYIDLDNGCRRNLDPLLRFAAWMPGTKSRVALTNHIMGSKPGHKFFQLMINSLQSYDRNWIFPYLTVMNSAGPHFVSIVWEKYMRTAPAPAEEVRILAQEEYLGNEWSFFTKEQGGTWHHWDKGLFSLAGKAVRWAGKNTAAAALISLLALVGFIGITWWIGWRLVKNFWAQVWRMPTIISWEKAD